MVVNYQQLIARYPRGGGASAATGEAFGEGWAFLPIGALIAVTAIVPLYGTFAEPLSPTSQAAAGQPGHSAFLAVLLAFPVAMALATGVEAPSWAIA